MIVLVLGDFLEYSWKPHGLDLCWKCNGLLMQGWCLLGRTAAGDEISAQPENLAAER